MEEWKEYKLEEVTSILGDGIHGTPKYDDEGNVFFINGNNLENGKIVIKENTKRVSSEEAIKHSRPLSNRTILVSINGTLGNVAKYNGELCILGKSACYFNVNEDVDLDFIYYVVANNQFKDTITRLATGTTIKNVSLKTMREYSFWMPSKETQKRVSAILKSLDDKIEVNRRINEQLEELAGVLFKSWFVDFEPFKDGEFVDSELGMIPKGWKVGTFSNVVDSTLGGDWGKENEQGNYTKEVFCIRGADIPEIKIGNRGKMPIRYILEKNFAKKSLANNDLVVEISGGSPTQSTGRVCRVTSELLEKYNNSLICTNFCRAIKPFADYSAYIYYYWQYLYDQGTMFNYENGTTGIKNLMINDILDKEPIVIPPINIVEQYKDVVETFATKIQKNGEEIEKLTTLRDTLLPKLMSGEIDVNEVEI